MPPKGKPKYVELYGVLHVGWRDALDFAHRLPKGRFDAFLLEAAFEDEKLKGWVDRKLRGAPSTVSLSPVDFEGDFFGYLNAQAHLIEKIYRSINHIINLENTSPPDPHVPFSKYLSQKFVGVNEAREALAEELNYMYNRDAKAWEIIKNAHFKRAIGWRGLYHLPFISFISSGDDTSIDLRLIYSNYFVNMRQQPIPVLAINPFLYEELIYTREIFGKKAEHPLRMLAYWLLYSYGATISTTYTAVAHSERDFGFLVTFSKERGEVELTPPTLFHHIGFVYLYKERVKVIPFSEVENIMIEKLQPFAEHLVDGWLSKKGKAPFTEEFLRQVEMTLWNALDAVIGALGGLDSIEIKREQLKP